MTQLEITKDIKQKALEFGADYVGIAGVKRFRFVPKGKRPELVLPKCKTVISLGLKFLESDMNAIRKNEARVSEENGFGYTLMAKMLLADVTIKLCAYISETYGAKLVPTTPGVPGVESMLTVTGQPFVFSQRRAAVAAGLGQIGWMGRVLNPECGPRAVWGSIITELELDEDEMMRGTKICNPVTCHVCHDVCPVEAIPLGRSRHTHTYDGIMQLDNGSTALEDSLLYNVSNMTFIKACLKNDACREHCIMHKDITAKEVHKMCLECGNYDECESTGYLCEQAKNSPVVSGEDFTKSDNPFIKSLTNIEDWTCGRCIANCPIGLNKE